MFFCIFMFAYSASSFSGSATVVITEIVIDVRDSGQIFVYGSNGLTYNFQPMAKNHPLEWPYVYGLLMESRKSGSPVKLLYDEDGVRTVVYVSLLQ